MFETGSPVVVGVMPGLSPCVVEYAARLAELLESRLYAVYADAGSYSPCEGRLVAVDPDFPGGAGGFPVEMSSDLESLCDDFYLIDRGRIILHEDTDVLLSDYAFLKVSADEFADLDQQYILQTQETDYGYCCLTRQKQYYHENYPQIVIEPGSIDKIMSMAAKSAVKKEAK